MTNICYECAKMTGRCREHDTLIGHVSPAVPWSGEVRTVPATVQPERLAELEQRLARLEDDALTGRRWWADRLVVASERITAVAAATESALSLVDTIHAGIMKRVTELERLAEATALVMAQAATAHGHLAVAVGNVEVELMRRITALEKAVASLQPSSDSRRPRRPGASPSPMSRPRTTPPSAAPSRARSGRAARKRGTRR